MSGLLSAGMTILAGIPASILYGMITGWLLRRYYPRPFRVAVGAACWLMLLFVLVIAPLAGLSKSQAEETHTVLVAGAGFSAMLGLTFMNAYHRLPLIGGPVSTFALAAARSQLGQLQRKIAKLEEIHASSH